MLNVLRNVFGGAGVGRLRATVEEITALESEVQKFSDDELKAESAKLREKIKAGDSPDNHLPRAFAFAREAARRTLGQRPYDEQLMGGLVLHKGGVAEMSTGEGKTLAAVAPVYLNALTGKGVHVVTVNEYLARRDAVWMGQVYRTLGLSVACLVPNAAYLYDPDYVAAKEEGQESKLLDTERDTTGSFLVQQEFLRPVSRREAYQADIAYGTNHEFGFDYLRDNLAYSIDQQVQQEHHYTIIDEVDSILIDEARTPLIISAPDEQSSEFYKVFARLAGHLVAEEDYTVDEKKRSVAITEQGIEKVEKQLGLKNLYAPENLRLVHYLEESLRAKALFLRDKDYVVKNGEILIVDEFTGRLLHGRRYNGGLHQAIEAKERVLVKEESRTYGKISIQNYFRLYKKIAGMTGTAQTSAEEFHKVYNLDTVSIPTHRPMIREDRTDVIYKTTAAKWRAVAKAIREAYDHGQPVLVGTTSIEKNEFLSALLQRDGVPHEMLNAKNNEREGSIIAQAGKRKAIMVATNMAGRGVDIILGGNPPSPDEAAEVRDAGGLHVIGTERHEARRIDNQLRGRSGRQGDPGSSQFYLSLEDDLVRIFGGDRIKSLMDRFDLPEDEPIQVGIVGKAIAEAQAKVEGANFDMRKHLLEYDDVLNKQRAAVYRKRQEILSALNKETVAKLVSEAAVAHYENIERQIGQGVDQDGAPLDLDAELKKAFEEAAVATKDKPFPEDPNPETLKALIGARSAEAALDPQTLVRLLSLLDMLWMNHLENLEALSESVGLRAYGQKDPLVEYRHEAHRLYKDFWTNFDAWIFANVFKLANPNAPVAMQAPPRTHSHTPVASGSKVGRNDPCPCGSGKKYKKCHGK